MDLSGLIFVVLAVAWAGYLIPRALRHHEEIAASRPVDSFSDTVRVLERTPATMKALLTPPAAKATRRNRVGGGTRPGAGATAHGRPVTRSAARKAARRRRRVLGLLLFASAATAGVAALHYIPWVSIAVPGVLVVGWLVLCRLMVRRAPAVRRRAVVDESGTAPAVVVEDRVAPTMVGHDAPDARLEAALAETASVEAALEDDGSLWDPLPLTLPTYVSKPAARRTVRTIDLTRTGVTSSGHHAEDSSLARAAEAGAAGTAEAEPDKGLRRKAAGA